MEAYFHADTDDVGHPRNRALMRRALRRTGWKKCTTKSGFDFGGHAHKHGEAAGSASGLRRTSARITRNRGLAREETRTAGSRVKPGRRCTGAYMRNITGPVIKMGYLRGRRDDSWSCPEARPGPPSRCRAGTLGSIAAPAPVQPHQLGSLVFFFFLGKWPGWLFVRSFRLPRPLPGGGVHLAQAWCPDPSKEMRARRAAWHSHRLFTRPSMRYNERARSERMYNTSTPPAAASAHHPGSSVEEPRRLLSDGITASAAQEISRLQSTAGCPGSRHQFS